MYPLKKYWQKYKSIVRTTTHRHRHSAGLAASSADPSGSLYHQIYICFQL